MHDLYPLKLRPIYKEKMWGGRNLARLLGKELPPGMLVGESWEISDDSTVASGWLEGRRLADLVTEFRGALTGAETFARYGPVFPLLVKFIDAQDKLSIQVHPDDAQARQLEGVLFGKTEMWYVLDASPGSEVIHGIEPEIVVPEGLHKLTHDRALLQQLHRLPVAAGDVFFIPAGTIHAMGEGLVICEVQQNSDVTYRLYDWDRLTMDGQPRELHLEKAIAVSHTGPHQHKTTPVVVEADYGRVRFLSACRYFVVDELQLRKPLRIEEERTFTALICLAGDAEIRWPNGIMTIRKGESAVIPAICASFELHARGECRVLRARVPNLSKDVIEPLAKAGVDREHILQLGGDVEHNDLVALL